MIKSIILKIILKNNKKNLYNYNKNQNNYKKLINY
jgi:hypothetical protein